MHYSKRTEDAYADWATKFIVFHGKRHPREMGTAEVAAYLTYLAVERKLAASTRNQAFAAILFLYRQVLEIELDRVEFLRAQRPERLPVVLAAGTRQAQRWRKTPPVLLAPAPPRSRPRPAAGPRPDPSAPARRPGSHRRTAGTGPARAPTTRRRSLPGFRPAGRTVRTPRSHTRPVPSNPDRHSVVTACRTSCPKVPNDPAQRRRVPGELGVRNQSGPAVCCGARFGVPLQRVHFRRRLLQRRRTTPCARRIAGQAGGAKP